MMRLWRGVSDAIRRYPTVLVCVSIITVLIGLSIYAVVSIPYSEVVVLWRGAGDIWSDTPRYAAPAWTNLFRSEKLPETFKLSSSDHNTVTEQTGDTSWKATTTYTFEYEYTRFPQEMNVFFEAQFEKRRPFAILTWTTPDGREYSIFQDALRPSQRYAISQDTKLTDQFDGEYPHVGLLADPDSIGQSGAEPEVLPGEYELRVEVLTFEEDSHVDSRFVVYGNVYGIAGTDHLRRDLAIGLLWGTPVALLFGLLATIGANITTFIIAAVSTWFGGFVDAAIQRVTEVNLMLPFLPILIMVGTFYNRSIWTMLMVIIVLSIFSASIKTYRAMFLQVKNLPYIEAARAYGASNTRIIFRYLIPKIVPVLIPNFVIGIPTFVFLEASLAVLGLGDPILPTWGKMLNDAYQGGALYRGYYYWVLQPAALLMVTGLSFAMLGFALDRVFNPRLRGT